MRRLAIPLVCVLALGAARSAAGQASGASLAGTWVQAETKRALDSGVAIDVGCHLRIDGDPLGIEERCGTSREAWGPLEIVHRRGSLLVEGDAGRRLTHRAGAPNELELVGDDGLLRLYRIPADQEETLAEWAMLPPIPAEAAAPAEAVVDEAKAVEAVRMGEPIVPAKGRCGCSASEAALGAWGLLVVAGWRYRRNREGGWRRST